MREQLSLLLQELLNASPWLLLEHLIVLFVVIKALVWLRTLGRSRTNRGGLKNTLIKLMLMVARRVPFLWVKIEKPLET
jgi:hypothetical protein